LVECCLQPRQRTLLSRRVYTPKPRRCTARRLQYSSGLRVPITRTRSRWASILANILSSQGRECRIRYDVPRDACGSAASSGSRPPTDVGDVGNLAETLGEQGTYNEAQTMYHELLAVLRRVLGPEHPQTLRDGQQSGQRTRCARHTRPSRDDVHCTKRCLWFSGG
jgi:hypothetical protein